MQIARCRVTEHKFKIGQLVYFHPKVRPQLDVVPGPYLITKRLPATEDGECQYEIRNTLVYNRVARESELTRESNIPTFVDGQQTEKEMPLR